VVLHLLLCGELPFQAAGADATFAAILAHPPGSAGKCEGAASPGAVALLRRLLDPDPTRRPTAAEALADAWVVDAALADASPVSERVARSLADFMQGTQLGRAAAAACVRAVVSAAAAGDAVGEATEADRSLLAQVSGVRKAGLDEGLLSLPLPNLLYMENPYSYRKFQ
jgi:calcium-dependent protein kinase